MHNDVAIVVQGRMHSSTEDILKYYNNYNCHLILSSYTNSVNFDTSKFNNFHITLNPPPREMGYGNRNAQKYTSYHGIKIAKDLGIKYVLKCRTDHFFKNPNLINILKLNLISYPLTIKQGTQHERLIIPHGGTTLNKSWGTPHISDHWLFGNTLDLYEYYNINNPDFNIEKCWNINPKIATEAEFVRLWAKNMKIELPREMSILLKDRFVILDNSSLYYDVVKLTGRTFDEHNDWRVGGPHCDPLTVDSRMWFRFYNNKTYTFEQENAFHSRQRFF